MLKSLLSLPLTRFKAILMLGLPITGGMLSQSLLNLVDTAMVGSLGETALAGVGVGSYANFVVLALITGLSAAVQTSVARRQGEQRHVDTARPVAAGLCWAVLISLPLTLIFFLCAPYFLALITPRADVLAIAIPYFEYRLLALVAIGINLCFRGYWNGINEAWVFLRVLLAMHVLNVIISYGLIFGAWGLPEMGAPGAGLGSAIALGCGALMYSLISFKATRDQGLLNGMPSYEELKDVAKLAAPNSLQQFLFAASILVLIGIISQLGTQELAIAQVIINIALLLILPAVGLGMASTTLVSHALGERRTEKAEQIGWDVVKVALSVLLLLSLPLWLAPEWVLSLFIHDPLLLQEAVLPLQITGVAICADCAAIVLGKALLGAGANRTVMMITLIGQWCFYLPLAWLIGPELGGGLVGIWLVQVLHRGLSSVVFAYIWAHKPWAKIRI